MHILRFSGQGALQPAVSNSRVSQAGNKPLFGMQSDETGDRFISRAKASSPVADIAQMAAQDIDGVVNVLKQHDEKGHPLLFVFDMDGTLTPFKRDVQSARLTPERRALLTELLRLSQKRYGNETRQVFLTGRNLPDALDGLGGKSTLEGKYIPVITSHGLHSFDCKTWATDENYLKDSPIPAAAAEFTQKIKQLPLIQDLPPNSTEEKHSGFTVHLANLGGDASKGKEKELETAFKTLAQRVKLPDGRSMLSEFKIVNEKGVLEIKPIHLNKGTAIQMLRHYMPANGKLVFWGDSQTDFPGLEKADIGVYLGKPNPELPAGVHMIRNDEDTEGPHLQLPDGSLNHELRTRISQRNTDNAGVALSRFVDYLKRQTGETSA